MHVGVIMDGNRRFARKLALDPKKGHEDGAKKFKQLLEWCRELNICELTLYTFSLQNFDRPKPEFNYLMNLFRSEYERFISDKSYSEVRIRFLGRIRLLEDDIQQMIKDIEAKTMNNTPFRLNFAFAYGGREEIIDAVRKMAVDIRNKTLEPDRINQEVFSKYLYNPSEPDMIIRTGGEKRLSNFLPFQSAYSELFFTDKMWPEFEKQDFIDCIDEFKGRQRRFGK
ncbi:di-trans,poly-cis-decaprenylcistransferase [Candidatus Woesearchaeota archaeon]|nr:di-trans,poly-cis-decaprenylcistransferase [Candidatus Woesearchaeota archaeon]